MTLHEMLNELDVSIPQDLKLSCTSFEPSVTLSPFSHPSLDDSDLQYSYEDLGTSLNQTYLQDTQDDENAPPSIAAISLGHLLHQVPDLPSFIHHSKFNTFLNLWLNFQKHTALAKEPSNRDYVQTWLTSAALQIHYLMINLTKSFTEKDPESSSRRLFSALRRLKDRIEIMHQVFQIIEKGRILGQSPTEAIAPLVEAAVKIRNNVSFLKNSSDIIPVIDKDAVNLMRPDQVRMTDLTNHVMDTYNLMPYSNSSTTASNNLISSCLQQDSIVNPVHVPYSYIPPSWLHATSLPVTPSQSTIQYSEFMSLPTSPTCKGEAYSVDETIVTPCNSLQDMTLSPYQSNSPLNTLSEPNTSESSDFDMELDEDVSVDNIKEDDNDDEYIVSDCAEDEDWKESKSKRKSKRNSSTRKRNNKINVVTTKGQRPIVFERQYTRRTATSYDAETTHYLKSIFFDIYSSRDKLTKDQRRQVQRETGLKPRNITYWFSNHKRRFQNSLLVFKKIVNESKGSVKNYNDFLLWRRSRGLSEDVLENEHLQILDSLDHSQDDEEEEVTVK